MGLTSSAALPDPRTIRGAWRGFLAGRALPAWGDDLGAVVMTVIAYGYTRSVLAVAGLWAVRGAAQVGLGPALGHLADRFDRRLLMLAADVLGAVTVAALGVVSRVGLLAFLALNVLLQGVEWAGAGVPTLLVPRVSERDQWAQVNAWLAASGAVAGIAAPLAAAWVMRAGAVLPGLGIDDATFGAAAAGDLTVWRRVPGRSPGEWTQGRWHPSQAVWALVFMAVGAGIAGREMDVLGVAQARAILTSFRRGSGLGVLEAVLSSGALAGALVMRRNKAGTCRFAAPVGYAVSAVALGAALVTNSRVGP